MISTHRHYFECSFKTMYLDWDAGKFGSRYGDPLTVWGRTGKEMTMCRYAVLRDHATAHY